jgi:protein ImuB
MSTAGVSTETARRIVSLWLPDLPTDRLSRRRPDWRARPLAVIAELGTLLVVAVNRAAEDEGLRPGMTLADGRALVPDLNAQPFAPAEDAAALAGLADWCVRYTPWAAPGGAEGSGGGVWLDITGCAHLWGGEAALIADLVERVARAGYAARAAVADTPGAAWAWARFGDPAAPALPPGAQRDRLAPLPVAGLRLDAASQATLDGLGLRRIGDLYDLPRAAFGARLGAHTVRRLDQALGLVAEPIAPRRPVVPYRVVHHAAEPLVEPAGIAARLRELLDGLAARLLAERLGVRRLRLVACRSDASVAELVVGTHAASRDPAHLFRLFAEPLAGLDAGFGIETLTLAAEAVEPLAPAQRLLPQSGAARTGDAQGALELGQLFDTLEARLGPGRVRRLVPHASHIPERAVRRVAAAEATEDATWPADRPRPVRLLIHPEPIEAVAPVPDDPPVQFRRHRAAHRVARARGPERIAAEWWRDDMATRDYYGVEDARGRRFWLFRAGLYGGDEAPRWFVHGLFA